MNEYEGVDESMLDCRQKAMRKRLQAVLEDLLNEIRTKGEPASLRRFVAQTARKYGMRRLVVREYLQIYRDDRVITIEDDSISLPEELEIAEPDDSASAEPQDSKETERDTQTPHTGEDIGQEVHSTDFERSVG